MLTRFMDQLVLAADGKSLEVCGPIRWDPGESGVDVHFILRQGGVVVSGSAVATPPADEWEVEDVAVPAPKSLSNGKASATGVAVVQRQTGGVRTLHWTHDVTLKKG